jgi:hypothetical protein
MGKQLIVNGQEVDVEGEHVTAGALKQQLHRTQNDWVMIKRSDGIQHLLDHEVVPSDVERISIVPAFEYGIS